MYTKTEKAEAVERLREEVKPGDTIYTQLVSVSRSGMYRRIRVLKLENNEPRYLTYNVARACEYGEKNDALGVAGCGMDMGFAVVNDLSYRLYGEGYACLNKKRTPHACPSPDHRNSGACRKNTIHKDGYALRQRWL